MALPLSLNVIIIMIPLKKFQVLITQSQSETQIRKITLKNGSKAFLRIQHFFIQLSDDGYPVESNYADFSDSRRGFEQSPYPSGIYAIDIPAMISLDSRGKMVLSRPVLKLLRQSESS